MGKTPIALTIGIGIAAAALAGCSGTQSSSSSTSNSAATSVAASASAVTSDQASAATGSATSASCPLTVTDAWVKAADSGMTAAFGSVANSSGEEATITAASTPAAGMTQLHETVDVSGTMKMQQVDHLHVPASGSLTLEPGGNHIMLMNIPAAIKPGQDVAITLTCEGGGTAQFTAQARTYNGANESYQPSGSPMAEMSMSPSAG